MISENQDVKFDRDLYCFLSMAIQIWPSLRAGVSHLTEVQQPHPQSFLPKRVYSKMTELQFYKIITEDLFQFIMSHDVKPEDIEDYLFDILDLVMMDEELTGGSRNPASVGYMANYTVEVIQELQKGNKNKIVNFQTNIYRNVKQFKGQIIEDKKNKEEESQSQSDSNDDQDQGEDQQQKTIQKPENISKPKSQQQLKKEQDLQDDGWIIVRK